MEAHQVIQLIIAFVAGINLPVIFVVIKRLGQIRDQLAIQNGRIGRLEEWRMGSDRRTDEIRDQVRSIDERCIEALQRFLHKKD